MPQDFAPPYGVPIDLTSELRRIVAPNPSPMTNKGTNTYILGKTDLVVIDPGPDSKEHLGAILNAVQASQKITHIVVTHSHLDHSPLARDLATETGAPVFAFGGPMAGRSWIMQQLASDGFSSGGEGIDTVFTPDICVHDGDMIDGRGWSLGVIHTPGHLGNHICLRWGNACFTGDHVMGWASSLVSPPDGDLTDFMKSSRRLNEDKWERFYPGHGDVVEDPQKRLDWLIAHRETRERSILKSMEKGPVNAAEITDFVYKETPASLIPAARRNVLAHLIDLHGRAMVKTEDKLQAEARFALG
ncbi:MAG: MBL fold metallo-hydrolase [Roseobacter sp.]